VRRRTLVARAAASVVLAGALLAGTAGCTFISQQATLIHYDPSDGIGASVGNVKLRNVIALASDDGKAYSLLVTFVNTSFKAAEVTLQFESGGDKKTIKKLVGAGKTLSFGNEVGQSQIIILFPGTPAGALYPVYVQTGDAPGQQLLVPVLTGDLPQYEALKPPEIERLVPTPTPTPTPVAVETPAPTDTPAP